MKKLVIGLLKIGISLGILVYLVIRAKSNDVFSDLVARPKDWTLLAAATGLYVVAILITFVRWWYLVRALGIEFSLREAVRLGLLGFLFNLAPAGIVGGDVLKAVLLARQQPNHRAESLVTVFVDRVIGLYILFLVAAVAAWVTGLWRLPVASVQWTCKAIWLLSAIGTVAVALPLLPDLTRGKSTEAIGRIPYVGPHLKRIVIAVRMYRLKIPVLLACSAMTVAVHCLFVLLVYCICVGLYTPHPTLATHFLVVPASSATSVIPLSLGPFEIVLNILYADIPLPDGGHMVLGQGLVVALGYRVITLLLAAVGLFYYLGSRREVAEGIHEAELEGITEA